MSCFIHTRSDIPFTPASSSPQPISIFSPARIVLFQTFIHSSYHIFASTQPPSHHHQRSRALTYFLQKWTSCLQDGRTDGRMDGFSYLSLLLANANATFTQGRLPYFTPFTSFIQWRDSRCVILFYSILLYYVPTHSIQFHFAKKDAIQMLCS